MGMAAEQLFRLMFSVRDCSAASSTINLLLSSIVLVTELSRIWFRSDKNNQIAGLGI